MKPQSQRKKTRARETELNRLKKNCYDKNDTVKNLYLCY